MINRRDAEAAEDYLIVINTCRSGFSRELLANSYRCSRLKRLLRLSIIYLSVLCVSAVKTNNVILS